MSLKRFISLGMQFTFVWLLLSMEATSGERITTLPGLNTSINFNQYSGYVTVDQTSNARLFYWFVESRNDPTSDPLILWLNGGPGCSSLIGFLEEIGPFYVKSDLTLELSEYSWNKRANIVFLESPAGVGFSKSDVRMQHNDEQTAVHSLEFLKQFFEMFSFLKPSHFWIAGESYAGHYIPQLAVKILEHNRVAASAYDINLKGIMIGNGMTDAYINEAAVVEFSYSHLLISLETYNGLREACNLTFFDTVDKSLNKEECMRLGKKALRELGGISLYDIYADVCKTERKFTRSSGRTLLEVLAKASLEMSVYARGVLNQAPPDSCRENYLQSYLNDPDVQRAIHAEPTQWSACSKTVRSDWLSTDISVCMTPLYTDVLFPNNLRILHYAGDVDAVVPAMGVLNWINSLNLNRTMSWQSWTDGKGQVGGYMVATREITFSTVRGAGHEAPTYQPMRTFQLFRAFLNGHI